MYANLSQSVATTTTFSWHNFGGVAPKDCVAAIAAMSLLPAEMIYWADSKTFGK